MDKQIHKYFQGELSQEERLTFMRNVESDASLKKAFIDYQNLQALLSLKPHAGDRNEGVESLTLFCRQTRRQRFGNLFARIAGIAAVFALLIVGTWLTAISYQKSDPFVTMHMVEVPAGQRACLTLEDGTQVWLNAKSTLTYPSRFSEKERRVTLIGEAFLTVKKDARKPFIVSSQGVDIEVLGTTFNVSAYPETGFVQTSLLDGSVRIYPQANPSEQIILCPNEEACYKNGKLTVSPLDNSGQFSWKEGVYSFDNEPFEQIIKKLQLYYDVKIVVKDHSILDFEYSGKFRQRDGIHKILQIIQKIQKFKIEIDDEQNVIMLEK